MSNSTNPPVNRAFEIYEQRTGLKIKTDRDFYERVGINQKRFALLRKGKLELTVNELKQVANVLDIPITDLL